MLLASRALAIMAGPPRLSGALHMAPRAALHVTRMQMQDEPLFGFGGAGPRPPSEKQLMYAQRLAQQLSLELPQEAQSDMSACSNFIDDALSRAKPTDRQIEFAKIIAASLQQPLPDHVLESSKAISLYIESNKMLVPQGAGGGAMSGGMGSSGSGEPTEKQILFAARLARQLNVGLSAEVLQSKGAMSQFLSESTQLANERTGKYGGMSNGFGGGVGGGFVAPPGFESVPSMVPLAGGAIGSALAGATMSGAGTAPAELAEEEVVAAEAAAPAEPYEDADLFGSPPPTGEDDDDKPYFMQGDINF